MLLNDCAKDYEKRELLTENDEFILNAGKLKKSRQITGDKVAIKTIFKKAYLYNRKLSKRLANEISILQTLNCDETVRLHQVYDSEENIELVMTLGFESLAERLWNSKGYDESEVACLIS